MPVTHINDDEFEALRGLPHEARSLYVLIRSRVDKNGIAGERYKLSEPMMREWLEVPPVQGSRRGYVTYSRQQVRSTLDCLVRNGLITRIGTFIFRLNFAMRTTPSEIRATDEQPMNNHRSATITKSSQLNVKQGKTTTTKPDDQPMSNQPLIGEEQPTSPVTIHHKTKRDENTSLSSCENQSMQGLLFEYWQRVMRHPKAKMDDKRRKFINKAIRIGYSVANLKLAIDGCAKSEWHMGKNNSGQVYDGLHLIFRDADQIDKFIRIADAGGAKVGNQALLGRIGSSVVNEFTGMNDQVIDVKEVSYG